MIEEIDKVSIFKMKESIKDFSECISRESKVTKIYEIETKDIVGKFYYYESNRSTKRQDISWIKFFNEKVNDKINGIYNNTYPRGVFIYNLKSDGTFYVMTFGLGAESFINKNNIVFDFGIKIAMNICDPNNLKRIQSSKIEAITLHSEKQISSGARLSIFDIDDEKEFLRKISTKASQKYKYLSTITGADYVQIKFDKEHKLTWDLLLNRTREINNLYNSNKYKEYFKNYDNFIFIDDKDEVKQILDELLLTKLKQKEFNNIYLTTPDFFDYERYQFSYKKLSTDKSEKDIEDDLFDEITLKDCLNRYKITNNTSIKILKNWIIYKYDNSNKILSKLSSVYKCLVAEIKHEKITYLLFNGKWKKVSPSLETQINDYFYQNNVKFESYDDNFLLQNISIWDPLKKQNRESKYNELCAKNKTLFMFDRSGFKEGEMCDLISSTKDIIHVKRFEGGSASISHLFTQARFYGELFITDSDVRKNMRNFIDREIVNCKKVNYQKDGSLFKSIIPNDTPLESEYCIILCVLSEGELMLNSLPFMARYEVYHTYKYLTHNRHFKVKLVNRKIIKGKANDE